MDQDEECPRSWPRHCARLRLSRTRSLGASSSCSGPPSVYAPSDASSNCTAVQSDDNRSCRCPPRALTIGDVKAALGRQFGTARTVEVLVLSATGLPFAGVVATHQKPSGRGGHRALACPLCRRARFQLYVRNGRLGCADVCGSIRAAISSARPHRGHAAVARRIRCCVSSRAAEAHDPRTRARRSARPRTCPWR